MRVGVTRDKTQLKALIKLADSQGVQIVPLPLLQIEPVAFDWPSELGDRSPDWLFVTSAHGVRTFFERLAKLDASLPESTKIGAVGVKTADALSGYGRTADLIPTESYGQTLFEEFLQDHARPGMRVIYARAEEVNSDPAGKFADFELKYYPVVCYRTKSQQLDNTLVKQFTNDDYILFTAPSAVDAFREYHGRPSARLLAIGRSTAAAMTNAGWTDFQILDKPEVNSVLEYVNHGTRA